MEVMIAETGSYTVPAEIKDRYIMKDSVTLNTADDNTILNVNRPVGGKTSFGKHSISDNVLGTVFHNRRIVA